MAWLESAFGFVGRFALDGLRAFFSLCVLITDTVYWLVRAPLRRKGLRVRYALVQFVEYGIHSLPIVSLICFLMGAILALQSAYQLANFGAAYLVADLVSISAMRELAPLMTAILIAGRSGSAIAAEIGTMKVGEELDALHVMGLNVTRFLVVPKFIGMLFAVPMLTAISVVTMIVGGFVLSVFYLGMDANGYIRRSAGAIHAIDLATGMTKSVFFAIMICWIGVFRGLQVEGGAEGVGRQTTSAVVHSIFMIIGLDLVFTLVFFTR